MNIMLLTTIKKELFFIKINRIMDSISMRNSSKSANARLLWNTIKKRRNANLINAIKGDTRFVQFKAFFSDWWCSYISDLEMINSNDFLKSDSLNETTSILNEEGYVSLDEEFGAMNLDFNNKKFLMVGSGPFPETVCFVSNHYNVSEIFGVDSNLEAIKNAEKILQIMSSNNKIKLIHSLAQNFNFTNIDVLFIANGLRNKCSVLDQVYKTSPKDINVIVRNPINLASLFYEDLNGYFIESNKWVVIKRFKSSLLGETILIKKKDEFNFLKEIDRFALLNPEARALVLEEDVASYFVLKQKSDLIAQNLRKRGVKTQEPVGVYIDRSFDAIFVILGILKFGGICVPLDKTYPRERIEYIIKDSQIKTIIFDKNDLNFEKGNLIDVVDLLLGDTPEIGGFIDYFLNKGIMYHLYTSGSTGKPKGIRMTLRSINNLIKWQIESSGNRSKKTLQFAPLSFDVSFQEIFSTLSSGSELILIKDGERFNLDRVSEVIYKEGITRIFMPFIAFNQIIKYNHNLASLREINIAGEQLKVSNKIRDFFGDRECILCNQYGPTETHVVTQYCLSPFINEWKDLPPIGRPIDNVELQIINDTGDVVSVMEVGQIVVSGVCLFDGYVGALDNNLIKIEDKLYYKTGDFGFMDIDGNINFLYRKDKQVKIRGYRVELGEIENALNNFPEIEEAVVVYVGDTLGVVIKPIKKIKDITIFLNSCKISLGDSIPEYMLPQKYIFLESLPVTSSGKVDRKKIEEMFLVDSHHVNDEDMTGKPIDKVLAQIWSNVLTHKNFSEDDNFFDVGGSSILLYKVQEQIKKDLNFDIKLIDLLEFTNISGLASFINKER